MAEDDPGQGLDLDILMRRADLGKIADLLLRELMSSIVRGDTLATSPRIVLGQAEARRRPFVEALRQVAHRHVAASADIGDDRLDRALGLRIGVLLLAGEGGGLDVARHCLSPIQ
jgi:hypothetical protein